MSPQPERYPSPNARETRCPPSHEPIAFIQPTINLLLYLLRVTVVHLICDALSMWLCFAFMCQGRMYNSSPAPKKNKFIWKCLLYWYSKSITATVGVGFRIVNEENKYQYFSQSSRYNLQIILLSQHSKNTMIFRDLKKKKIHKWGGTSELSRSAFCIVKGTSDIFSTWALCL